MRLIARVGLPLRKLMLDDRKPLSSTEVVKVDDVREVQELARKTVSTGDRILVA